MQIKFTFDTNVSLEQRVGFQMAAGIWSKLLKDDVTINLRIGATDQLGENGQAVGGAIPIFHETHYGTYQQYLEADATTAEDQQVIEALQAGNNVAVSVDGDIVDGNTELMLTRAQAKALGMEEALVLEDGSTWDRDMLSSPNGLDGYILVNTSFDWNYDLTRAADAPPNTLDFLTMALHEIGHSLGFVSGLDGLIETFTMHSGEQSTEGITSLDLMRHADGDGIADLTFGDAAYFSIDGGQTHLAEFEEGDEYQASHWQRYQDAIGIFDPTLGYQERTNISHLDLNALDAIGWDVDYSALAQGLDLDALYNDAQATVAQTFGVDVETVQAALTQGEDWQSLGADAWFNAFKEQVTAMGWGTWFQGYDSEALEMGWGTWFAEFQNHLVEMGWGTWFAEFESQMMEMGWGTWFAELEPQMMEMGWGTWFQALENELLQQAWSTWFQTYEDQLLNQLWDNWSQSFDNQVSEMGWGTWFQNYASQVSEMGWGTWFQNFESQMMEMGWGTWFQEMDLGTLEMGWGTWFQNFDAEVLEMGWGTWFQNFEMEALEMGWGTWFQEMEPELLEMGWGTWFQEVDHQLLEMGWGTWFQKFDAEVLEMGWGTWFQQIEGQVDTLNDSHLVNGQTEITENAAIAGGAADDILAGGELHDFINGVGGDDLIDAKGGDDVVFGGDGNDIAYGWTGKDTIFGGDGDDFIAGENGIDHLYGEVGHDIISGGRGDDYIDGGAGRDAIKGDTGADILYGGGDEDLIDGGSGADLVIGGTGKDTLEGGMGDDILYGDNYFVPVTDNPNATNESADPTVSADQVLADLGFAMRLEAEDMRLKNYKVDDQAGASGGKVIKTQGQGRAKTTFNGPSGTYDLIVGYEDQAEGVAEITLEVKRSGSRQEYTWHLDGSAGVGTHTLAGITLEEGDEIILKGRSDSDADLALLDYLDIVTPGLVTEDGNGDTSTVYEVMAGSDGQQADIRIETEDMVLGGGYTPFDTIYASGDAVIQNLTQGIGTATYTYTGETGVYNLYANYFDNILGSASATVLLNGETLHSWQFDKNDFATHDETLGLNITLNQGDVIEVQGKADWLDFAAIDYLMLEAVPEPPSSETITPDESSGVGTVVTIEAEQMNIAGGALRAGDFASEGGYVETAALAASDKDFFSSMAVLNGSSDLASLSATDSITDIYSISSLERLKATSLFTGESGYYNVVVGYYDTTGGEAEIALKIDNQEIDRWYADQDFADVAGTNSLVNRTVAKGIAIDQFDLIELDAIADGADKGNIDYIQFIKVALPTVEAAPPVELPDPIRVEAENMTLSGDYSLESQDFSSGDQLVKTSSSLTATTEFDGPTGLYDIVIGYYDEIDGQSPMTVSLDGTELDSWTFDQTLGGYLASAENFVTRTISGVSLEAGAMLALQASRQSNEFARIDYVEFVAVPTPTPATPETVETLSDSGDILRGGSGNDTAYGGAGDDDIYGDSGDDILYGDFAAANGSNAIDAGPTAGLVGHWTFDESSGSQVVDTTGAHSGNLTNMTGSEWTAGQIGGGLAFDGSNDRVVIADADALDLSNTLTLTTWVKADHFGDWNGLIVKGDQDIAYGLALASDGGLSFTANYGSLSGAVGSDDWLSNGTITAGQWHHVAVTYDGSNIQFYIDGQLDSSFAKSNLTFGNSDAGLLLGADLAGTHFDGVLDDARVYNRALEIGEIEQLATLQSTSLAPANNDISQTLTFQQGINGYTGVADTHIRGNGSGSDDDDDDDGEGDANDHFGSETSINVDGNDNGTPVQGLIRFDNLFGNQAGQIALSDTIDSAILELQVSDAGNGLLVYDMLQNWTEYANWNSFTNGIQANNIDAASSAVATTGSVSTGTLQIDITASVRAWQANPSNNRGLTFLSTGSNGVEFWSSESGNGPRLVVDVDRADSLAPAAAVGTFDGDDATTIAHADNMLLNNGTLGFSFQADNVWNEQGLFSKDSMYYDDGGHVTVSLQSGILNARFQSTNQTYSVQALVTSGQDYDVAITFGDRGLELWLDGVLVDMNTYTGGLGTSAGGSGNREPIVLGAEQTHSGNLVAGSLQNYFSGTLQDVRLYDQQLNSTEIAQLPTNPINSANIVFEALTITSSIQGEAGNDTLTGGEGNDTLFGELGDDTLNGTDAAHAGALEIDNLTGGVGADLFILGDAQTAYYSTGSHLDYAVITDFNASIDQLQLHGSATQYSQVTQSNFLHLYYNADLVAQFKGITNLNLDQSATFV